MKPVHIFRRVDSLQHALRIHLRRQRQLNQNAVRIVIAVQILDNPQQPQRGHARVRLRSAGNLNLLRRNLSRRAVWNNGSLTVQGVVAFKSQQPESAVFAVTGGTGRFDGAAGILGVSFTKNFKILTIKLN